MLPTQEWTDFASSIEDPNQRAIVQHFVAIGKAFISHTTRLYGIRQAIPQIFIKDDPNFDAFENFGAIVLHRGVIDHALKADATHYTSRVFLPDDAALLFANPSAFTFLWVLAHEFFHCTRLHHTFLERYPDHAYAFEYDADCMATAAVFRYAQATIGAALEKTPIPFNNSDIKRIVVYSLFWPIRLACKSSIEVSSTHPNMAQRLATCLISKLARMDHGGMDPDEVTEEQAADINLLFAVVLNLEDAYLEHQRISPDDSPLLRELASLLKDVRSSEIARAHEQWSRIYPEMLAEVNEHPSHDKDLPPSNAQLPRVSLKLT